MSDFYFANLPIFFLNSNNTFLGMKFVICVHIYENKSGAAAFGTSGTELSKYVYLSVY